MFVRSSWIPLIKELKLLPTLTLIFSLKPPLNFSSADTAAAAIFTRCVTSTRLVVCCKSNGQQTEELLPWLLQPRCVRERKSPSRCYASPNIRPSPPPLGFSLQESPQRINCLHLSVSPASSSLPSCPLSLHVETYKLNETLHIYQKYKGSTLMTRLKRRFPSVDFKPPCVRFNFTGRFWTVNCKQVDCFMWVYGTRRCNLQFTLHARIRH